MKKKKSNHKFLKFILIVLIIIIIGLVGLKFAEEYFKSYEPDNEVEEVISSNVVQPVVEEIVKEVQIYKGADRPIAVMIDNHDGARPQVSLNDAYIVYEIIVEGNYTRLMPVFKGVDIDEIGPVRSSRHYFLDYALENDAIYVHFGWSPQAQSDISKLDVDNINGLVQKSSQFWRTSGKYAPHNVITSTEKILEIAELKGYNTETTQESVLNYVTDEVVLEDGIPATEVYIPYSSAQKVKFIYDEETQRYTKYSNGKKQTDWRSKEDITTKNIIITFAKNYTLSDGSNKGRQGLNNVGTLNGYYITNGKAIEIKCVKESRKAQTIYEDLEGNEIEVNDGNTFIQICPINTKVTIEGEEEETLSSMASSVIGDGEF